MADVGLTKRDMDLFNRAPTDQELLKLSKCVARWWELAKELGLSDAKIAQIKADHNLSVVEQCYQALKAWKNDQYGKDEGKLGRLVLACKEASVDQAEVEKIFNSTQD
ncbi:hypothetical protein CHS0354_008888 [Potamilus streckersoni]|uniref:Death domain-containing protein n=1 Tax=Potamilus streckersoni TaxID=2493646 RepID=A0AAE0TC39_9BIVA|nr:hypothetical protein CHS0354_008888 [Potamilus streckersoni]